MKFDWSRNALLLAIVVCLGLAWRIYDASSDPGDGRTGALALTIIAAVLTGALLTDWARRGEHKHDDDEGDEGPKSKGSKGSK